ncbi:hypothetical protein [Amycolatopsis vastitatis]|uniref:Uncharacterized protein n=1 Tax=Amycolatopsis vastitatis TaxID=1905142 RepID=A0A229SNT3_9PSEU|nr:hypothetical protein [Amycolatopsis vastitatis]OXM60685.1 hypothetical protein CF165_41190 [Amycolatopsis vastitatis]
MTAATPYPYPYSPPPAQPPRPAADPGALFRLLAGILGVLAAVLVLAGSFLPQTSFEQVIDGKTESNQTVSAWSRSFAVEPDAEAKKFYDKTHVARYGIPLTAGAVVLLAGAGLAFAGARRSAGGGLRSGARTALVAGGAGVTAAVWMLGMDVSATLTYTSDEGSIKTQYATGTGFWMLLGGGVLALLALAFAVLAGRRAPAAAPAGPPGPYQQQQPYPGPPQQFSGAQPYPGTQSYPPSQPFPAQAGGAPYPGGQPPFAPQSQPFPAQSGEPAQPSGPPSQPFPAQPGGVTPRLDDPYGGVTQAQSHPAQQPPTSPTEPNYQLPPLRPPNT